MGGWIVKLHPDFLHDLDKLSDSYLNIFRKRQNKIRQNPLRLKHLAGGANCYREEVTSNIRLIYYVEGNTIWFLTIGRHDIAYLKYIQRLYSLGRTKKKFDKSQ